MHCFLYILLTIPYLIPSKFFKKNAKGRRHKWVELLLFISVSPFDLIGYQESTKVSPLFGFLNRCPCELIASFSGLIRFFPVIHTLVVESLSLSEKIFPTLNFSLLFFSHSGYHILIISEIIYYQNSPSTFRFKSISSGYQLLLPRLSIQHFLSLFFVPEFFHSKVFKLPPPSWDVKR